MQKAEEHGEAALALSVVRGDLKKFMGPISQLKGWR